MNDLSPHVYAKDGVVFADSRQVAEVFGKRHDNVLRDIRKLLESLPSILRAQWFQELREEVQTDFGTVEVRPFFEMTRDGFTLLAFGFTGEKAMAFKIAYIERFNEMEQAIHEGQEIALEARVQAIVERQLSALLRDQKAILIAGYVTAHDVWAAHVRGKEKYPRSQDISAKLMAYCRHVGSPVEVERQGLKPRALFPKSSVNAWLLNEGKAWMRDRALGQGMLRLVPKTE